jgi:amino-acid N-acetyltransferase
MNVRPARITDVAEISALVNSYAQRNLMLPRPLNTIYEHLRDFIVLEEDGKVRACGALHVLWYDLAEIRSVAVHQDHLGRRFGVKIVESLITDARELGIHQAFMLILPDGPMWKLAERLGFSEVSKESLPHKVWSDCLNCPKFTDCDEFAVIKEVGPKVESPHQWNSVMGAYVRGPGGREGELPISHALPMAKPS